MFDACIDNSDGDAVKCHTEITRKARKEHTCQECGATIFPGEKYCYEGGHLPSGFRGLARGRYFRCRCWGPDNGRCACSTTIPPTR